jgi:hypothetical protein
MPVLRWKKDGSVVPKKTNVHVGSEVVVEGRFYEATSRPASITVFRQYRGISAAYRRFRHREVEEVITTLYLFPAGADATLFLTESLTVPNVGLRIHAPLWGDDGVGNRTSIIYASQLGGFQFGPNVTIAGIGGGLGHVDFTASVDPEVEFSLLSPWNPPGTNGSLADLLGEIAVDTARGVEESPEEVQAALIEQLGWALPPEPPPGWELYIPESRRFVDEGQTVRVEVNFVTPTPGRTALAIQAEAVGAPGLVAASEVFVLEVDNDLVPSLTFFD